MPQEQKRVYLVERSPGLNNEDYDRDIYIPLLDTLFGSLLLVAPQPVGTPVHLYLLTNIKHINLTLRGRGPFDVVVIVAEDMRFTDAVDALAVIQTVCTKYPEQPVLLFTSDTEQYERGLKFQEAFQLLRIVQMPVLVDQVKTALIELGVIKKQ